MKRTRKQKRKILWLYWAAAAVAIVTVAYVCIGMLMSYPKVDSNVQQVTFVVSRTQIDGGLKGSICGQATIDGTQYCLNSADKISSYITDHGVTSGQNTSSGETYFTVTASVKFGEDIYTNRTVQPESTQAMPTVFIQDVESAAIVSGD